MPSKPKTFFVCFWFSGASILPTVLIEPLVCVCVIFLFVCFWGVFLLSPSCRSCLRKSQRCRNRGNLLPGGPKRSATNQNTRTMPNCSTFFRSSGVLRRGDCSLQPAARLKRKSRASHVQSLPASLCLSSSSLTFLFPFHVTFSALPPIVQPEEVDDLKVVFGTEPHHVSPS